MTGWRCWGCGLQEPQSLTIWVPRGGRSCHREPSGSHNPFQGLPQSICLPPACLWLHPSPCPGSGSSCWNGPGTHTSLHGVHVMHVCVCLLCVCMYVCVCRNFFFGQVVQVARSQLPNTGLNPSQGNDSLES